MKVFKIIMLVFVFVSLNKVISYANDERENQSNICYFYDNNYNKWVSYDNSKTWSRIESSDFNNTQICIHYNKKNEKWISYDSGSSWERFSEKKVDNDDLLVSQINVQLQPNPVNTILFVRGISDLDFKSILICDVNGSILYSGNKNTIKEQINVSKYNCGVYYMVFETKNTIFTKSFIINR